MAKIKEFAPWEFLEEDDIFAVQNATTGELGFVRIMGAIGEHYAIAVYLGEQGLYGFWDLQESPPDESSYQRFFNIPQLQASFEDRDMLHPEDRAILKKLGLTFRGKNSWPMFRSFHPGFFPWYMDSKEALFLQYVLEQTLEFTKRCEDDFSLLIPGEDDDIYFLRKGTDQNGTMVWEDSTLRIVPQQIKIKEVAVNMQAMGTLKKTIQSDVTLEIDLIMVREPLQDKKNTRPYYPYVLLVIDMDSGNILNFRLLLPLPSYESMWGTVPAEITSILAEIKLLPAKIMVSSDLLYELLLPVAQNLRFSLDLVDILPDIDDARDMLTDFMLK